MHDSLAKHRTTPSGRRAIAWLRLMISGALVVLIWTECLPRLAQFAPIRDYQELLDRHQVDASAMFYTELPNLHEALGAVDSLHRRRPETLWIPTWQLTSPAAKVRLDLARDKPAEGSAASSSRTNR